MQQQTTTTFPAADGSVYSVAMSPLDTGAEKVGVWLGLRVAVRDEQGRRVGEFPIGFPVTACHLSLTQPGWTEAAAWQQVEASALDHAKDLVAGTLPPLPGIGFYMLSAA